MSTIASQRETRKLSPSTAAAIAAGGASAAASCVAFLLWSVLPTGPATLIITALPLILSPFLVAGAAWMAAQGAVRALLAPMVASVERMTAQDLDTPVMANAMETAALATALEQCRATFSQNQRGAKVHGAIARLFGTAVERLAEGDFKARITLDLPEPYKAFRNDFNRAMERLEETFADLDAAGPRLASHVREINDAAEQLSRRAGKLFERIETDMQIIDAGAQRDPQEALRIASHTLSGAKVAARRNQDAATHFVSLGQRIAAEAGRLKNSGPDAATAETAEPTAPRMPAAVFPVAFGANALKLRD